MGGMVARIVMDVDSDSLGNVADALAGITRAEADRAEHVAAGIMQKIGFSDAVKTVSSGDQGIDVRSSNTIAQVKWQAKPVGRPAVQQLGGAWLREQRLWKRNSKMFFFSKSGYTPQAVDYADAVGMVLFEFSMNGRAKAVGKHAMAYRKKTPSIVTSEAKPRKPAHPGRARQVAEEVAAWLALALLVLVPVAVLATGGFFMCLGVSGLMVGPTAGDWWFLMGGVALVLLCVVLGWSVIAAEPDERDSR